MKIDPVPVGYHRELLTLLTTLRANCGNPPLRAIAAKAGRSLTWVSEVIGGRKIPSGDAAAAIAKALGATVNEQRRARAHAEAAREVRQQTHERSTAQQLPRQARGADVSLADKLEVPNAITGGILFNTVVQGNAVTVMLPATVAQALRGLPPTSSTFTGRDRHLRLLLQALAPDAEGGPVLVSAVAGLAGVGKTELVVQIAKRAVRKTGWFPGGVLFVDMFGYDSQRQLSAGAALLGLLQAFGMRGEHIPADEADRSLLFRSVLAAYVERGRRILLVIDNAASANQVIPLLPSDGVTATLITSRHTLDVGARLHDLTELNHAASVQLLARLLDQARGPEDTRVQDEADAVAKVADLCAGLPLALRIAAALLADHATRPVTSLARTLAAEHTRLDRLARQDRAVKAAFDLSYESLDHRQALLFRLLPVNPGPDVSTEAVSHLADLAVSEAEQILEDLARAHLIEPTSTWGRWRQHDLVRLYARQVSGRTDEIATVTARLLRYYLSAARAADEHLLALPEQPVTHHFNSREDALAWFDAEWLNLKAAVDLAATVDQPSTAVDLAATLGCYLPLRRRFAEWTAIGAVAIRLARQVGDPHREGLALNNYGIALRQTRRLEESIVAHQEAISAFQRCDETVGRLGEARAWNHFGVTLHDLRRFDDAVSAHQQAITLFQKVEDHRGEGWAWCHLGEDLRENDLYEEALTAQERAVRLLAGIGERSGESAALIGMGLALHDLKRFPEAIDAQQRAGAICQEVGDRQTLGYTLNNIGLTLAELERFDEAIEVYQGDLAICRELSDPHGEAGVLYSIGRVLNTMQRFDEAIDFFQQAAILFHETDDCYWERIARSMLGWAWVQVGRFDEARNTWLMALETIADVSDEDDDATTLIRKWLDDPPPP
ncbi:tetratricopeptide repeat protein [Dactylosporangium sp. NPDC006015]|uniref:tetratricopeptide repeat protein n=1 Tax=Dactylosporangium sp. NPDC006015 TaxID=3154576 RepID=UPI00339FF298